MDRESLEKRPAIFVVGSPNVGKRTLLSRLLGVDFEDASDPSPELLVHGWTINTKYYTADVAVWTAHLSDELYIASLPVVDRVVSLVMVFDTSDLSSFAALKKWVSSIDIQKFDILLCLGNKVDLLPGHPAHIEYKRRLLKKGESSVNPLDFSEYGISETEGSSLLGNEESSWEFRKSHIEWCLEHNIEYVEACASNIDFDKCLSVDGDSQGVERLYGALSAHMWPGMQLKSGDKINNPSLPVQEELSEEEESDYEPEYEILSSGAAESWEDIGWMSADGPVLTSGTGRESERDLDTSGKASEVKVVGEEYRPSTSASQLVEEEATLDHEAEEISELDEDKAYDFEDLEVLMAEIGNMRNGLRLMPDFQRREMAAKLAMKMAMMFGDSSGGEEGFD
ncbi:hypothetical protein ACS0TY_003938 [Phlomoides rotata]